MLKSIFKMPSKDWMALSDSFIFYPNLVQREWAKEDDYYLAYLIGVVSRVLCCLIMGIIWIYSLSIKATGDPQIYLDYIDWAGRSLLLLVFLFFMAYLRGVDLDENNIFRKGPSANTKKTWKQKFSVIASFIVFLFVSANVGSGVDGIATVTSTELLISSYLGITFICFISTYVLSISLQATFLFLLGTVYILYEGYKK